MLNVNTGDEVLAMRQNNGQHTPHESHTCVVECMPVVERRVFGKKCTILIDTGSNTTIIRRALVPDDCMSGNNRHVILFEGSAKRQQEAVISVDIHYTSGEITTTYMENPIYALVLGKLLGVRGHQN